MLTTASMVVGELYILCNFGDRFTERMQSISFQTYQLAWYLLPLDAQRKSIMIMNTAQRELYLQGYFGTQCTLQMFKNVTMITTFVEHSISKQTNSLHYFEIKFRLWTPLIRTWWCFVDLKTYREQNNYFWKSVPYGVKKVGGWKEPQTFQ